MTLQPIPFEFPYILGKFSFLFISVHYLDYIFFDRRCYSHDVVSCLEHDVRRIDDCCHSQRFVHHGVTLDLFPYKEAGNNLT
jgi:hypothetical protein